MKVANIFIAALAAAQAVAAKNVYIYGKNVNVRSNSGSCATKPSTSCASFAQLTHKTVEAKCQRTGQSVTVSGVGTNNWWTLVKVNNRWGWVTNLYIQGGHKISGVPDCTSSSTPAPTKPAPSKGNLPGLNAKQSGYARTIAAQAHKYGVGKRGCEVAIATAMQGKTQMSPTLAYSNAIAKSVRYLAARYFKAKGTNTKMEMAINVH
ncbi:hypothetical protein HDV00_010678 [Rhizophlyctis rosea]|nr:hypothetical protein HDV00_010678 [Rhizophlyctis rosea]